MNPVGYDDRQLLTIKKLQINDAYSLMRQEEKADTWASEDPSLFAGSQTIDEQSISMFRTFHPPAVIDNIPELAEDCHHLLHEGCNVIMNSSLTLQILCAIILCCFCSIVLSNTAMTNTAMMKVRKSANSNETDRDHESTSGFAGKKNSRFDFRAQESTPQTLTPTPSALLNFTN